MSRFSVVPARVIEDERFSLMHMRVLLALCSYTDEHGWCFPSRAAMAGKVRVSTARITQIVKDLCAWGYVGVTQRARPDGSQTSNAYRVLFDVGEPQMDGERLEGGGKCHGAYGGGKCHGAYPFKEPI